MNFPYSKTKWTALVLAGLMMTSAGTAFADTRATDIDPTQQTTQASDELQNLLSSPTLTLDDAIKIALKQNSSLQSARINAKNSEISADTTARTARDISSDDIEGYETAQSKYAGKAKAEMILKLISLQLQSAENKAKLGAQQVYYDYLHALSDYELKKQSLKRAETQLKVAQAAFNVGTKAKTDILQTEMGVAGAQASLISAQNTVSTARMKLNQFLGVDLMKEWDLTESNKQLKAPAMTLEEATAQALQNRVEIKEKDEQVKIDEINVKQIEEYLALSTNPGKTARNALEISKLNAEEERNTVRLEVAQAYNSLNAAKQNVEYQNKALASAQESYRLTNLRFENGLATTLEVIQAEESLASQENSHAEALHNYNLAVVNFENALGVN